MSKWRQGVNGGESRLNTIGKLGEACEKSRTRNYNGKPKQREIKSSLYEVLQYWN